jgi:hypothetical protein
MEINIHQTPDLPEIIPENVNLQDIEDFLLPILKPAHYTLMNVYTFGSRCVGLSKPNSDFDFICVVKGAYYPGPKLIEKKHINLNIFSLEYFQFLINENIVWVLQNLYLPSHFTLKEERKFDVCVKKECVRKGALMDAFHNWQKAKRLWYQKKISTFSQKKNPFSIRREGDIPKSKKNIAHGLRYLNYGFQLIKTGKIYDLTEPNTWWKEVK